jgi:hypothetical protein
VVSKFKKCSKCKRVLNISEFNWKRKYIKKASHCKDCSREYIRTHYKNKTSYYLRKAKKRNLRLRNEAQNYIGSYLLKHWCIDCGEKDILVLEFDHRVKSRKEYNVSRIIRLTGSIEKLKKEIDKCEVRCANCHRRKTEMESNSWKLKYAPVA